MNLFSFAKNRQLDIPKLITAITLIAIFAMAVRVPYSPDMWWHLYCAEEQWRTRSVILRDTLSHTVPGTRWVNHGWLPQLAMYPLYTLGGFPALALAVAALVTVAFGFSLFTVQSRGRYGHFWRALVVLWAAISTAPAWVPRPYLVTIALTAVWVYILDRYNRKDSTKIGLLWCLPPLMLLWANSHAGYIIGLLLLASEIGGRIVDAVWYRQFQDLWTHLRPLAIITLLCTLVTLLNPQGIYLVLSPFHTLVNPSQQELIAEWASPNFHAREMLPFLALLLVTWSTLTFNGRKATGIEWVRLLGFTFMALRSGRNIALFAIVAAPTLYNHGTLALARLGVNWGKQPSIVPHTRGIPVLNWMLLVLVLLAAIYKVSLPLNAQTIDNVHSTLFPVDAVTYMRAQDWPPTLFNDYGWGGYLIWALNGNTPVFIDGRTEPYDAKLMTQYSHVITARRGWQEILDEYQVHTALIPVDSPLASVMREHDKWQDIYQDEIAIIFVSE